MHSVDDVIICFKIVSKNSLVFPYSGEAVHFNMHLPTRTIVTVTKVTLHQGLLVRYWILQDQSTL